MLCAMIHRIFIVDDDESMLLLHRRLIDMEPDMQVCGVAEDAKKALAEIRRLDCLPSLMLIDYSLQHDSALDLIHEVRECCPDVMCVILSGYPEAHFGEEAIQHGAAAYIEKGDAEQLYATIRELLATSDSS